MKILVTGATGNVGRLVVDELLARGATDIRALTTNPAKAALPDGVEVVEGYLGKLDTLPAAYAGVDRMYLAPLLGTVREATALARDAGIGHIVDLAGDENTDWGGIEEAVEASGVPWTHLETGEFMANTLIWADQIRAGDVVRDCHGAAANAPIAMEDIASVAAQILLAEGPAVGGHEGRTYTLTGPQTLTRVEKVRAIGRALGRDIEYAELSPDEAVAEFEKVMGEYAEWYVTGMGQLVEHPQQAVQTVAQLTGRPGMTFEQWAVAHAAEFR